MDRKTWNADWFDILAYLLMTAVIILFIMGFVRNRWNLQSVLNVFLLAVCVILVMVCLRQKQGADKYRAFSQWMREGNLEDRRELMPELQEELQGFLETVERKYSYENVKTNMEYTALQNQINPHFLYNTLDAIRGQAISAGQTEIADMTGKMSRFFRYSIKNRGDLVSLAEELGNVEDYFSIQHYRFEDRFTLDIQCVNPEILRYYLPKMTFQPIVENALYHGLEPRKGKGKLTIRLERLERTLRIVIRDDGKGMDEMTLERIRTRLRGKLPEEDARGKRTGIAIYNVNKRLQILFGEAYGLQFFSEPGMGTDVEIRIPLVDDENRGRWMDPDARRM